MSSTPTPAPLENLGPRPFSFFPPILHVEHNEFLFRRATWSEVLVVNCKSGEEIWIPRRFLGELSKVEDPLLIVGLNKELEYKGGSVWPHERRVIAMPLAVGAGPATAEVEPATQQRAPHSELVQPRNAETRIFRLIGGAVALAILLYLGAVNLLRLGEVHQRVVFTARDQSYLELTSRDRIPVVIEKLGAPETDRWLSEVGEIQYRALGYAKRRYTVILMGSSRDLATYIGTMDENWKPVHAVDLPSGGTTSSLLRGLRRF